MTVMNSPWFQVINTSEVPSPALLIYPDRVTENIRRMIALAGGVARLRPHMKTNKLPEVTRMQLAQGITKFKCATIAEAEMTASCGAPDVLIAYQPVGPNVRRLLELVKRFPATKFSTIVDDAGAIRALSEAVVAADLGSARGPRATVGGSPTGTSASEVQNASNYQESSLGTARRAAALNTPAACAPQPVAVEVEAVVELH
jgi:diaminopimelate decarboxylase